MESFTGAHRSRWSRLLFLVPVAVLAYVLQLVSLPYYVFSPGPARDVTPLIEIEGHATYPTDGRLLLTSVTYQPANVYEIIGAWLDPARTVVPERDLIPRGSSQEQEFQVALSQMDTSKIDAVIAALSGYANYPDERRPGVLVEAVLAGGPADGKLFAGDLLTAVEGRTLGDLDDLRAAIQAAGVGGTIAFTVEAGGETREVTVTPGTVEGVDGAAVGISPVPNFPFPILIDSGDIGGPSAGLMWTLGIVEQLTPGDLTAGRVIAGTGTIAPDGTVGPIGGVEEKVVAAERAGAVVFLVPRENAAAARTVADQIVIVPVATYAEAVAYLDRTA